MNLDAGTKTYLSGALQALHTSGNMAAVRQHQDERDRQLYATAHRDALIGVALTLGLDADFGDCGCTLEREDPRLATEQPQFTPREGELMTLILEGKNNDEIASKLGVAYSTVRNHRANIYRKTNSHSAQKLAAWQRAHPLTDAEVEAPAQA